MLTIDGATGEGGGQILRTGLALSMITGKPVRFDRIRAGRAKPGLMRQHLTCVTAAQTVSGAEVEGASLGSQSLTFVPGEVRAGEYRFAVGSAGSCLLVLQTVLPALMLAPSASVVHLSGGTHNPMAPTYHFIERAFVPQLQRMGAEVTVELRRHGFYPAGGGEMVASIQPVSGGLLRPVDLLQRGAVLNQFAESVVAAIPRGVAARELAALQAQLGWPDEQLRNLPARQNEGPGNVLMVTLEHEHVTEVFTALGEKGKSAEQVAQGLLRELRPYMVGSAAAGPHLADQLALPWALAVHRSGRSAAYTCSEVTPHTRTNLGVIERFLPVRSDVAQVAPDVWQVAIRPHRSGESA